MRDMDVKERYLWLMRQVLTDYLRIDNEQANARPMEFTGRHKKLRLVRDQITVWVSSVMGMLPVRRSRFAPADRRAKREQGLDWPPLGETMLGLVRLEHLGGLIEQILADDIPGDLLEAGVWRGGASIYMQAVLTVNGATDSTCLGLRQLRGPAAAGPERPAGCDVELPSV